ncbi:MAG TPA: lactonase family protein [Opitutaceae bacterium]|nr:lactonase family protein [Opitutaceae bacterium]
MNALTTLYTGLRSALLASALTAWVQAESWTVFFGTSGPGAEGIYRSTFDTASGKLAPATLAAPAGNPGFLALHPKGKVLYAVATLDQVAVAAGYRLGADGSLTLLNSSPIGDGGAAHVAVHPSGKFLLTAQYGGGSVALFPLDAEGRLGKAQLTEHEGGSRVVAKRQDAPHPHWCGFSPDGRFALVPDLGLDGIVIYRVDTDKPSITKHGFAKSFAGGGARHMRFSPDGRFIYLLDELSLTVTTFAWNAADGSARTLATVPALSEEEKSAEAFNSAAEILVHPTGRFVYSSNRGHDTVSVFQADPATAALKLVQIQPVRGAFPRNINLAPGAGWLLAAGQDSNTVSVHNVNSDTGKLTYQTKGIINVPAPICILFVKP